MSDAVNEAELGRSKQSVSPADHLMHLLGIGWNPNAPLIQKFIVDNRLQREFMAWQEMSKEVAKKK